MAGSRRVVWGLFWLTVCFLPCTGWCQDVVINEIMYHPSSLRTEDEYIELLNRGTAPVSLKGWRITDGVDFNFPAIYLQPGQYLVVAANLTSFTLKYPGVTNVVGKWRGHLDNPGERIEIEDSLGNQVDEVRYADSGDWAQREEGPLSYGHRGWVWSDAHGGGGRSLELINPNMPNQYGQNWAASSANQGTPGAANSVGDVNVAPLILDVSLQPILPKSTQSVAVTARLLDEAGAPSAVTVHYRKDGDASFLTTPMRDDGLTSDGLAGDGVYGAILPPQPDKTVVELYIEARDIVNNTRTYPAPSLVGGVPKQTVNLLYLVDDTAPASTSMPLYHLIMTNAERQELVTIGDGTDPPGVTNERYSSAQMNGTFISRDKEGIKARYNVGVRNRGEGTSGRPPNNYHVSFRPDHAWSGVTGINLNSKYGHLQLLGSLLFAASGVAHENARAAQVRVNGANLATSNNVMYGSYCLVEARDSDFVENHFPSDPEGNLYRAVWSNYNADLRYFGENPASYAPYYLKETNQDENDWRDFIELTRVLNNTPDSQYVSEAQRLVNVEQWMEYFALNTLLTNNETCLGTGYGDDFGAYRGLLDRRFVLLHHDNDTILGKGGRGNDDRIRPRREQQVSHRLLPARVHRCGRVALQRAAAQPHARRRRGGVSERAGSGAVQYAGRSRRDHVQHAGIHHRLAP